MEGTLTKEGRKWAKKDPLEYLHIPACGYFSVFYSCERNRSFWKGPILHRSIRDTARRSRQWFWNRNSPRYQCSEGCIYPLWENKKSLFDVHTHTLCDQLIVAVMEGYNLKGMLTQSLTLDFIMRHVKKKKTFSKCFSDVIFYGKYP